LSSLQNSAPIVTHVKHLSVQTSVQHATDFGFGADEILSHAARRQFTMMKNSTVQADKPPQTPEP
jgi:hypothetical protein